MKQITNSGQLAAVCDLFFFVPINGKMNAEERKILLSRISRNIERTREKIEAMEEMTQPIAPENSIGRVSRMDAIQNKSVMEAALRTARQELEDLEYAQNHIHDPEFGTCKKCKKEIDLKRLMLMPGSPYCIRCAS